MKDSIRKRTIPSPDLLEWRKNFLSNIKSRNFSKEYLDAPLLETGNSKIGQSSHRYNHVYVWNLPAVKTCPSASVWCLTHCYNADERDEKFPIDQWNKNLMFFLQNETELENIIVSKLTAARKIIAIRIHSSGDFFSNEYIAFWIRIINRTPDVIYWAYTRSWNNSALINKLEELKQISNIQLFASWDDTMPLPPDSWRKSIVSSELKYFHENGINCPEQSGKSPNCATCNYCLINSKGDVHFILH